jgi:hypothetical protein
MVARRMEGVEEVSVGTGTTTFATKTTTGVG